MKRLVILIVIVIISLYTGAYFGKDNLNNYALTGGKQVIKYTKLACVWITTQWQEVEEENEDTNI